MGQVPMNKRLATLAITISLTTSALGADQPSAPAAGAATPPKVNLDEVVARVNSTEIKRRELQAATQAALILAFTSWAQASMFRSRPNWRMMTVVPR